MVCEQGSENIYQLSTATTSIRSSIQNKQRHEVMLYVVRSREPQCVNYMRRAGPNYTHAV